jgi:ribosomal-protein-alanine N-acetyltransferase
LGTEIAQAVLTVGFTEIRAPSVIGFTLSTNRASRALMTKLGMTYEGPMEHAGLPHQLYRLTASTP